MRQANAGRRLAEAELATQPKVGKLIIAVKDGQQTPIGFAVSSRGVQELIAEVKSSYPDHKFQEADLPYILR